MYCPFCGLEIYDHASICTHCSSLINLPVELTEAEIRRLNNSYKERFHDRSRVEEAISRVKAQSEYIPALYGARVFAFVVDWGIVAGIAVVFANQMKETRELALLGAPLIGFLYFSFLMMLSGRTIGKYIVGIKVIDENTGVKPGFYVSVGRTAAIFVSMVFLMAGFLAPYFDSKSRSWHDILSGTRVIYRKR